MKTRKRDFAHHVGAMLRAARTSQNISLADMALYMKMSVSGWSRCETGDTIINVNQLQSACKALICKPSEIVSLAETLAAAHRRAQSS